MHPIYVLLIDYRMGKFQVQKNEWKPSSSFMNAVQGPLPKR